MQLKLRLGSAEAPAWLDSMVAFIEWPTSNITAMLAAPIFGSKCPGECPYADEVVVLGGIKSCAAMASKLMEIGAFLLE